MRVLVVGLGVQGKKRINFLNKNKFYASVDTTNKKAIFKNIKDVPVNNYDSVYICTPDHEKLKLINYCLKNKKHVLVEKPLNIGLEKEIKQIEKIANKLRLIVYTAYNHRFEPHFINIKNLIKKNFLGKIYYCSIFYGNGTAKLVKRSPWRDTGSGIINDLGTHLVDIIDFWLKKKISYKLVVKDNFENKSPDHAILISKTKRPLVKLEMSMCRWKNDLDCEIIGSKGSLIMKSLCKWGPSSLTLQRRVLPSGPPKEKKIRILKKDPTWALEQKHFEKLIRLKKKINLKQDIYISKVLKNINR